MMKSNLCLKIVIHVNDIQCLKNVYIFKIIIYHIIMIDLIYYKNKYFDNYCVISNNYLLDDIRNNG